MLDEILEKTDTKNDENLCIIFFKKTCYIIFNHSSNSYLIVFIKETKTIEKKCRM